MTKFYSIISVKLNKQHNPSGNGVICNAKNTYKSIDILM